MSKSLTTRLKRFTPFAEERFGPHMIVKTGKTVGRWRDGEYVECPVWACKWCEWESTHPTHGDTHFGIKSDCDGIEWSESAKVNFEDKYE